jgi:hypothetical protein
VLYSGCNGIKPLVHPPSEPVAGWSVPTPVRGSGVPEKGEGRRLKGEQERLRDFYDSVDQAEFNDHTEAGAQR